MDEIPNMDEIPTGIVMSHLYDSELITVSLLSITFLYMTAVGINVLCL